MAMFVEMNVMMMSQLESHAMAVLSMGYFTLSWHDGKDIQLV